MASVSKGATVPENYVTKNGVLVVDGDMRVNCRVSDRFVEKYKDTKPPNSLIESQLKEAAGTLRYCKDHGYKSPEDTRSKSAPVKGSLPDTGGISLAVLGAGILLTAGGLLYRRRSL